VGQGKPGGQDSQYKNENKQPKCYLRLKISLHGKDQRSAIVTSIIVTLATLQSHEINSHIHNVV
jgi:hypothetical protein